MRVQISTNDGKLVEIGLVDEDAKQLYATCYGILGLQPGTILMTWEGNLLQLTPSAARTIANALEIFAREAERDTDTGFLDKYVQLLGPNGMLHATKEAEGDSATGDVGDDCDGHCPHGHPCPLGAGHKGPHPCDETIGGCVGGHDIWVIDGT